MENFAFACMPRVEALWCSAAFQRHLKHTEELEAERPFCRHDASHLLDVARIMWIANLEQNLGLNREVVYATALLHDIGRDEQHETGIPHDVAAERIACEILFVQDKDVQFTPAEQTQIRRAILGHRSLRADASTLEELLFFADKASRACYACEAREACNWPEKKKNPAVVI